MDASAVAHTWSRQTISGTVDCDLINGFVARGSNIAPKESHTATGHTFRALFAEWDWSGWIKPQVDALASIGGNCIRMIGDMEGVNDGTFTQSYYEQRWGELIDYAASLGMRVYPALGGVSQITLASLTIQQVSDTLAAIAGYMDTRSGTVMALDLIQESVRSDVASSYALGSGATFSAAVRAVTAIPITYSFSDNADRGSRFAFPLWKHVLDPMVDFFDLHVYTTRHAMFLYDTMWSQGVSKPIVIGEFGSPTGTGTPEQLAAYDAMVAVASNRRLGLRLAGCLSWSIFDQGIGTLAYGMFSNDGTPRLPLTERFQSLPIM